MCLLAAAHTFAQSANNNVGIGTSTPLAQLDVVGDTLGIRKAGAPRKNFWINLTGNAVHFNASDAASGITFKIGINNGGGTAPTAGSCSTP